MSKMILITSDDQLSEEVSNFLSNKNCSFERFTEKQWNMREPLKKEKGNVISLKNGILPVGRENWSQSLKPLTEVQTETIRKALYSMNGNISRVSKALGIGRATIYRKIKEHNINLVDVRGPQKSIPKAA